MSVGCPLLHKLGDSNFIVSSAWRFDFLMLFPFLKQEYHMYQSHPCHSRVVLWMLICSTETTTVSLNTEALHYLLRATNESPVKTVFFPSLSGFVSALFKAHLGRSLVLLFYIYLVTEKLLVSPRINTISELSEETIKSYREIYAKQPKGKPVIIFFLQHWFI